MTPLAQPAMLTVHAESANAPGVEYRAVVGLIGYAIGDDGSVWSRRSLNGVGFGPWHLLVGFNDRGYRRVNLRHDGKIIHRGVHRLVLEAFVGAPPHGFQAMHGNGNRADNRLLNLRWGTAAMNAIDRERHGATLRGTRHGMAKLAEIDITTIRQRVATGPCNKTSLAREYGIARSTLGHIVSGRNWSHLP